MSQSATATASEQKTCPKCGSTESWGFGSWCPSCGYYPALGTTVDIKTDEKLIRAAGMSDAQEPIEWHKVVPTWAWVLMGCIASVAAISFLGSSLVSEDGPDRLIWTIAQCTLGGIVLFVAQMMAYLFAAAHSDKLGMFDMFMKPIEVWKATFLQLPRGAYRLWIAGCGFAAIVCALTIVGGIDYESFFNQKKKKKKANVVHAVVAMGRGAPQGNGADSMEEAMNQFAGDANVDAANNAGGGSGGDGEEAGEEGEKEDEQNKEKKDKEKGQDKDKDKKAKDEKKKKDAKDKVVRTARTDCVIFGYTEDEDGSLALLLLAAIPAGERSPRFVATVTAEDIGPEQQLILRERLPTLERPTPIVKTTYRAKWLQPKLMCRVEHQGWTRDRKLKNAAFGEMLPDVGSPRPADNKVTVK